MLTIQSRSHTYTVEASDSLGDALDSISDPDRAFYLVDANLQLLYPAELRTALPGNRTLALTPSEDQKSLEAMGPVFLALIAMGLKRSGKLVVVGGGVLQDIGCFIASTLSRGIRWEFIPTTLLAQADSCIGSKSSLNIGPYKNQLGTFYPPHRILMPHAVLRTLPWDQVGSGIGEILKLAMLTGEVEVRELAADLNDLAPDLEILGKWIPRALAIKKVYIEEDEFDLGRRNLLNYGHTFGHAFESATRFAVPHGSAVVLGMLAVTFLSASLGLASQDHYHEVRGLLLPWCSTYCPTVAAADFEDIMNAMRHDKKNSNVGVTCILTRGFGSMEKRVLDIGHELAPLLKEFMASELNLR